MSATLLPFGLLAVNKDGRDIQVLRYDMLPAAASIARNQLVRINPATGTLEAQTDGVAKPVLGTFAGVEYFDSTGRYTQAPDWVAQAGATNVYGFVQFDPGTIYEVQADGPVALTAMGAQCNMTNSAAQNALGFNIGVLATATISHATANQLQIVGKQPDLDNNWGDNFTKVLVKVSNPQFYASNAPF